MVLLFFLTMGTVDAQNKRRSKAIRLGSEYYVIADSLYQEGLYDSAVTCYSTAAEIFESESAWIAAVDCYQMSGECYYNIGNNDSALYFGNRSLGILKARDLLETSSGSNSVIKLYMLLGWIYFASEDFNQGIYYFLEGVKIIDKHLDTTKSNAINNYKASFLYSLGQVYVKMGDYNSSLNFFKQALPIYVYLNGENNKSVINTFSNIGGVYLYKEDFENARIYFTKAENIIINLYGTNSVEYADILINLGTLFKSNDEYEKAKRCLFDALDLYTKNLNQNDSRFAIIYNNISEIYLIEGLYSEAIEYYQKANLIAQKRFGSESSQVAFIDNNIALMYYKKEEYQKAIPYFESALQKRIKVFGSKHFRVAQTYYYMGCTYLKMLQLEESLKLFQRATIALCTDFNDTSLLSCPNLESDFKQIDMFNILCKKARALFLLYLFKQDSINYLIGSYETYLIALSLLDDIRKDYFTKESQMLFAGNNKQELLNALFVLDKMMSFENRHIEEEYFVLTEKLKSFALYTSLSDLRIKALLGIPDSILKFESNIQTGLSYQKTQLQKLRYLEKNYDTSRIVEVENKILQLTQTYDSLIKYYNEKYPEFFKLKYKSSIPTVYGIQSRLSESEVVVNYLINDSILYILTISDSNYNVTKTNIGNDFQKRVWDYFRHIKKAENITQIVNESMFLYSKLIYPINNILKDKRRLILVPDEYLAYIPFETLIKDKEKNFGNSDYGLLSYLINDFEIIYNYSASLWMNASDCNNVKEKTKLDEGISSKSFIGFAPAFNNLRYSDKDDFIEHDSVKYNLVQRSFSFDNRVYQELPYSIDEVEQINDLFIDEGNSSTVFINHNATKSNFIQMINSHKYVHIATHGFSNDEYPELCGLAFYPTQDSMRNEIEDELKKTKYLYNDNILFSGEMFGLDIDADLLVLSACETGIGKLEKAEGLMAMTRGFLYSGVRNIVYSLWKVNDKFTRDLMVRFYQEIISGNSYSNALRMAKMELIKNPASSHPVFWSSFLMIGE